MRVYTSMMQRLAVDSMLNRQSDLNRTQLQLASGKRILTPSEDPSGSARMLALKQQLAKADQYQDNIGRVRSRLEAEENVLESSGDALLRMKELAQQGLNSTYGIEERTAVAAEVWLVLDELLELANSKDGTGEYLFSGLQSQKQPFLDDGAGGYTYQGDNNQRRIKISETRQMESSHSGSEIFENVEVVAGGKQNIFKTLYDFANALEANAPNSDILTDLDTALSNVYTTQAQVGARLNALDGQENINAQFKVQTASVLSGIEDLDYAEAVARMNLELAGLQASQQSFQRIQNLSLFNSLG